jgi:hypothetical protein
MQKKTKEKKKKKEKASKVPSPRTCSRLGPLTCPVYFSIKEADPSLIFSIEKKKSLTITI